MIRTVVALSFIVLFLVFYSPVLGILLILSKKNPDYARDKAQKILENVCKGVLFFTGTKLTVIGKENIPKDTPSVFIGNHTSYLDPLIILSLSVGKICFIAKNELQKIPLLKSWMLLFGCCFLDREDIRAGLKVILDSVERLKSGVSVMIFPEGTRRHDNKVGEFKAGSFKAATKSGCPIVPVTINRADDIFENHFPRVKVTSVTVTFSKPIQTKGISVEEKKNIAEQTRSIISEHFN